MHPLSGLLHYLGRPAAAEIDFDYEVVVATHHRLTPLRRAAAGGAVTVERMAA
jgi:hypothetical protein